MQSSHAMMEKDRQMPKSYQDIMKIIGDKGPYQRNLFIIFFTNWLVTGLLIMQTSFLFMKRDYDCANKGLVVNSCHSAVCNLNSDQRKTYYAQDKFQSIPLQFDYGECQDQTLVSIFKMMIYLGTLTGYLIFLFFTDNFGRRFSMLMAWGVTLFGSILLVSSQNIYMACIALFIAGSGCESAIRINMAVFGEVVDYYLRQSYSVGLQISFGLAGILISVLYYAIGDWRLINIIFVAVPAGVLQLLFIFYFEQTPKFILRKGIQPALKSFNRIGKINKGKSNLLSQADLQNVLQEEVQDKKFQRIITPIDLFRFKSLRLKSICCCSLFFFLTFLYFGPVFLIDSLGFDIYISQIVVSGSQLIACPLSFCFIRKIQRVKAGVISFGLSGILTGILIFVEKPQDCNNCIEGYIELVCIFGSRFCIAFYFSVYFLFVNQLFPLQARGMGFGVASAVGAIASSIGPFFMSMLEQNQINPMIFMTLFAFLAIIMVVFLPETHSKPLLKQIEEIQLEKKQVKQIRNTQRIKSKMN